MSSFKDQLKQFRCLRILVYCIRIAARTWKHPILLKKYLESLWTFYQSSAHPKKSVEVLLRNASPYLLDATSTLSIDPHYTYHTAWAARLLAELRPEKHIDISSQRYFVTLVSAFIPIDYYEYRPAELYLSNLSSKQADVLALPFDDKSISSISCMHTVEHIGLGRYGDSLDPEGDKKAFKELARVLADGGYLFFVVPMAEHYVLQFNEQRIYSYKYLQEWFAEECLEVKQFSLIPDDWHKSRGLIENATEKDLIGQRYACGCFLLQRAAHKEID